MNIRKTEEFVADVERQFEWYAVNAGWDIADRYLTSVAAVCQLLGQHPHLGPSGRFTHPKLREWRFFLVFHPFQRHVIFYEVMSEDLVLRRAMHGHRDLPRRLLEPSESD